MLSPRLDADIVTTTARSVGVAVILAALLLVAVEAALQTRSQLRTGASVFSALIGRSTFVRDSELGIRLLRPGSVVRGERLRMHANRYGLRGPEFELESRSTKCGSPYWALPPSWGRMLVEDSHTSAPADDQSPRPNSGDADGPGLGLSTSCSMPARTGSN